MFAAAEARGRRKLPSVVPLQLGFPLGQRVCTARS